MNKHDVVEIPHLGRTISYMDADLQSMSEQEKSPSSSSYKDKNIYYTVRLYNNKIMRSRRANSDVAGADAFLQQLRSQGWAR